MADIVLSFHANGWSGSTREAHSFEKPASRDEQTRFGMRVEWIGCGWDGAHTHTGRPRTFIPAPDGVSFQKGGR